MPYSQLSGTYIIKSSSTLASSQTLQQTAKFQATPFTSNVPPMSQTVVADYKPYTDTYQYDTLLHKPASQKNYAYNPSGYFKISDHAYIPTCTLAKPRACDSPIDVKFTSE